MTDGFLQEFRTAWDFFHVGKDSLHLKFLLPVVSLIFAWHTTIPFLTDWITVNKTEVAVIADRGKQLKLIGFPFYRLIFCHDICPLMDHIKINQIILYLLNFQIAEQSAVEVSSHGATDKISFNMISCSETFYQLSRLNVSAGGKQTGTNLWNCCRWTEKCVQIPPHHVPP